MRPARMGAGTARPLPLCGDARPEAGVWPRAVTTPLILVAREIGHSYRALPFRGGGPPLPGGARPFQLEGPPLPEGGGAPKLRSAERAGCGRGFPALARV